LAAIKVDDLDATRQAVIETGGTVTVDAFDFPGGRRFHFHEPGGNELAAWVPVSQG
jgi:predicted enzyme related to lactoylglutathione lyase